MVLDQSAESEGDRPEHDHGQRPIEDGIGYGGAWRREHKAGHDEHGICAGDTKREPRLIQKRADEERCHIEDRDGEPKRSDDVADEDDHRTEDNADGQSGAWLRGHGSVTVYIYRHPAMRGIWKANVQG